MHRRRLRDESTYDDLCRRFADDLRVFRPTLDDDRFDLDLVAADDDTSRGTRRAPLEEIRRNITAAGLTPVERDGRFASLAG